MPPAGQLLWSTLLQRLGCMLGDERVLASCSWSLIRKYVCARPVISCCGVIQTEMYLSICTVEEQDTAPHPRRKQHSQSGYDERTEHIGGVMRRARHRVLKDDRRCLLIEGERHIESTSLSRKARSLPSEGPFSLMDRTGVDLQSGGTVGMIRRRGNRCGGG